MRVLAGQRQDPPGLLCFLTFWSHFRACLLSSATPCPLLYMSPSWFCETMSPAAAATRYA